MIFKYLGWWLNESTIDKCNIKNIKINNKRNI
jgi:hypothetical protein